MFICCLCVFGVVAAGRGVERDGAVVEPPVPCALRLWIRDAARGARRRAGRGAPFGWRPTTLLVTVCRCRCRWSGCGHAWRPGHQQSGRAAGQADSRRSALEGIVCQHLTVARVAEGLGVAWDTANEAVLAAGRRVLIADPARFDGMGVLEVDEHVWRDTRRGDKNVIVIIDLTDIRDCIEPARLLDMAEGRSKQAFKTWLIARPKPWRNAVDAQLSPWTWCASPLRRACREDVEDGHRVILQKTSHSRPEGEPNDDRPPDY